MKPLFHAEKTSNSAKKFAFFLKVLQTKTMSRLFKYLIDFSVYKELLSSTEYFRKIT